MPYILFAFIKSTLKFLFITAFCEKVKSYTVKLLLITLLALIIIFALTVKLPSNGLSEYILNIPDNSTFPFIVVLLFILIFGLFIVDNTIFPIIVKLFDIVIFAFNANSSFVIFVTINDLLTVKLPELVILLLILIF